MIETITFIELRVLGSLIEKSKTTPDYYPMTLNGLTAACNQKTSRKPVTDFSEEEVMQALNTLKLKSLVANELGGTSRTMKFRHTFRAVYQVSEAALSVLCLLMLRGPLTAGEINTNSGRLYEFQSLEEILNELDTLRNLEVPLVKELPRQPGQKENRWIHLLGEVEDFVETSGVPEKSVQGHHHLEDRIRILEEEVAELKLNLGQLIQELKG
jgi:uncharacterized protein YceH (UPF0502 family)